MLKTKIKTYADACKALGKNPRKLPDFSKLEMTEPEQKFHLAVFKLSRIYQALNMVRKKLWVPTKDDLKYYPWMWHVLDSNKPSGVGLSYDDCGDVLSFAHVAARLCGRTSEITEYVFKQFQDLYEDMICYRV